MVDKDNDKTSIQVSVIIRDLVKEFCDSNGFKMNRFVEKSILDAISGSYNLKKE